ncbi:MAG: AmmeMemoRadiSam system protein B [Candidatus Latescibacteria bacterium]|jgi:MEMO1 family protein|nr:AmmeMemoRadiSam system protein B [Candidatus Latescibacterota bacterium]
MPSESPQFPKLRNIEAFPVSYEGQEAVCLRDPDHFASQPIFINPAVIALLRLFDGSRSVSEIHSEFVRENGISVSAEQLAELVDELDSSLFLDSENFRIARSEMESRFRQSSVRMATHAGGAYSEDPAALREELEAFYMSAEGPGELPDRKLDGTVTGLIAPHIDFNRGGSCYAWAYRELATSLDADLFVILGIGHAGPRHMYSMTAKDYDTPLGTVRTDSEFVSRVQEACPFDVLEDEFLHRDEHSVEFQVVFLKHLLGSGSNAMIVPVLCGSFHELVLAGESPADHPHFRGFVEALQEAIRASGKRVCVIAGVDLAHIGQHFGDEEALSDSWLQKVQEADMRLLGHVESLDEESLFRHICEDQDQRRVCGYPAIYTMMTLVNATQARLLKYGQAADSDTQQAVTFASMVLE